MKITFERLQNNNLALPAYATIGSAAFDLSACLTRKCKNIIVDKNHTKATLNEFTVLGPFRKYDGSPGHEKLYQTTPQELFIQSGETIMIPTGFKASFINAVLKLYVRSSLGICNLTLANNTGIIDSDYRGEIFVVLHNESATTKLIRHGDRIAQGILMPLEQAIIEEGTVDATQRGAGGFGSTN